jgi:hypothetical protein
MLLSRFFSFKLKYDCLEVFINHKNTIIEKIILLDTNHSRMKFYSDQIKLPVDVYPS